MKNILLLNNSVFVMFILGLISLLVGLQGNYLISFFILALAGALDYFDYFITKKSLKNTPFKLELKTITRFMNFSLIPTIFSFYYLNLIEHSFLVYIPLVLYLVAGILSAAYHIKEPNFEKKIPLVNISCFVLILFLRLLYNSKNLWFLFLLVMLFLSYLIIRDISKKLSSNS